MPPIDFPLSPAINQEYTFGGRVWVWNGTGWDVKAFVAPLGATGVTGVQGATGVIGVSGATGVAGPSGATGPVQGSSGLYNDFTGLPNLSQITANDFAFNNSNILSATTIYLSSETGGLGNEIFPLDVGSRIYIQPTGYPLIVVTTTTSGVVNNIIDEDDYYSAGVSVQYTGGVIPDTTPAVLTVAPAGGTGATGATGAGTPGATGIQGTEGPAGKSVTMLYPAANDKVILYYSVVQITASHVFYLSQGSAGTAPFSIRYGTDIGAAGTEVMAATSSSSNTGTVVTSFTNAIIPSGQIVWLQTGTLTNTVSMLHVSVRF